MSDSGNKVARQFGLAHRLSDKMIEMERAGGIELSLFTDDDSNELPLSSAYVVGRDGKIVHDFTDVDFTRRADPEEILKTIAQLA